MSAKKNVFAIVKQVMKDGEKVHIKDPPIHGDKLDLSKLPKNSSYTIVVFK